MGQNADGSTRWATKTEWAAWFDSQMAGGAAAGAAEYATTTGALSSSTIGGLARKAIRGGVYGAAIGLAVEGIIDGAGWAISELKDQVLTPGTKEQLGESGWCRENNCASTIDGLIPWAQKKYPPSDPSVVARWIGVESSPVEGYLCALVKPELGGGCASMVPVAYRTKPTTGWGDTVNVGVGTDPGPVSDEDLGNEIRKDPGLVNSLLTDPRTDRPVMTPELQQQGDDLKKRLEEREGYDPSDPSTSPDLEDDTANDDGSPWPTFCGWATSVCDFITWFKTDDPESESLEVPWEEESPADYEQSWSSGLGGGSCPSAVTFTVALGGQSASPEFSFEGLCRFATMMRPVIIALASIIAGFIIAGVRGTKDA